LQAAGAGCWLLLASLGVITALFTRLLQASHKVADHDAGGRECMDWEADSSFTSSSLLSTKVLGSNSCTVETAAAGAGGLPGVDSLREDDGRLWMAVANVLELMETQGGPAN
jgi:hypothetical protein